MVKIFSLFLIQKIMLDKVNPKSDCGFVGIYRKNRKTVRIFFA